MLIPLNQIDLEKAKKNSLRLVIENKALTESMKEIGQQKPITVGKEGDKYFVFDGLFRCLSAKALGWTEIEATLYTKEDLLDFIKNNSY